MIGDYLPADISDSLLALYPSMINKRKLTQDSSDENSMKPSLKVIHLNSITCNYTMYPVITCIYPCDIQYVHS